MRKFSRQSFKYGGMEQESKTLQQDHYHMKHKRMDVNAVNSLHEVREPVLHHNRQISHKCINSSKSIYIKGNLICND